MKIALLGYGKMGKMIEALLQKEGKHEVVLKITSGNRSELTSAMLKTADVAIDFSVPAAAMENISLCLESGIPLVIGTTGWYKQLKKVKSHCKKSGGAIVYASNFSIGVNIVFELNRLLAKLMNKRAEYEPMITEVHHTRKKDAPSGTAITLANDIIKLSEKKNSWVNTPMAKKDELVILSVRSGNVTGNHSVTYESAFDKIEISHEAFSREGFASGAVAAAEWIVNKKGCFEFREIISQLKGS